MDIQSIATEISRLRCFLTLVVDQRVNDSEENRGIVPLPNLDFKFVTANSLIGLPDINNGGQSGLFDNSEKIDELKDIRDLYFNASDIEREQLKTDFVSAQKGLIYQLIEEHGFIGAAKAELTKKLTDWDPFSHKSTSWFDSEWMFGIKEGFDIVVANPPFVFGGNKGITDEEKKTFKKTYFSGSKKINLFALFLEKGTKLLKPKGYITYIVPNTLLRVTSYSNIREYLIKQTQIIEIVDLDIGVFENVTASTIIISLCNLKNSKSNQVSIKKGTNGEIFNLVEQSNFNNKGYIFDVFSTDEHRRIINKLNEGSSRLGDLCKNIRFGVVITNNIDQVVSDNKVDNTWKPFLEGNEISNYSINYLGRYLHYKKELLHRSRTPDIFETNKILIQRITGGSNPITAAYDTEGFYNKESIINLILKSGEDDKYKYILGMVQKHGELD